MSNQSYEWLWSLGRILFIGDRVIIVLHPNTLETMLAGAVKNGSVEAVPPIPVLTLTQIPTNLSKFDLPQKVDW